MFEKDAEEYTKKSAKERWNCNKIIYADIELAFQKGAEFGYNKANKWHDLKKDPTDLPKENGRYLCLIETSVGGASVYECSDYDTQYNSWKDSYGDVIKWKEIE